MTNIIKFTSRRSIQWTVEVGGSSEYRRTSMVFMFRNRPCHLEYCSSLTDCKNERSHSHNSYLYFKCTGELQPPVKITVFASANILSKILHAEVHSTTETFERIWGRTRTDLKIWTQSGIDFRGQELTFEVIIYEENHQVDKSVQTASYIDTRFSLEGSSKDFAKLLDEGPNHDVEFAFGDQIIKAHKNVLSCRSDVFTSMFQSDMVEGETGRVNIQDTEPTIFRRFLECLYTGVLPELTVDIAMQLYATSDKYAVSTLKLQCAEFLIHNLSPENACEILVLADLHNDVEFKKGVMEYVFKQKIPVEVEKEKWSDFCSSNKDLALEVYDSFCRYICQK